MNDKYCTIFVLLTLRVNKWTRTQCYWRGNLMKTNLNLNLFMKSFPSLLLSLSGMNSVKGNRNNMSVLGELLDSFILVLVIFKVLLLRDEGNSTLIPDRIPRIYSSPFHHPNPFLQLFRLLFHIIRWHPL